MLALGGAATIAVSALPQPAFGHVPAATVGFIALAVWPAMSRVPSRRWRIAATATSVGLLGWLAVGLKTGDLLGLSERVLAGVESVVPLAVVLGLLTRRKTALDPR